MKMHSLGKLHPSSFILHPSSFRYGGFRRSLENRRILAVGKIGILVMTRIFGTVYQFPSPILPLGAECGARCVIVASGRGERASGC